MKIVFISSSFRRNGNTEHLLNLLEKHLVTASAEQNIHLELESVFLSKENLQPCRGCRLCFDKGEYFCPIKDGTLRIRDKINEADAIVLASPVYVEDVNGVMKNWIDRLAFTCHRPSFYGKSAAVISTSAAGSSDHTLTTMANALITWGFQVISKDKFKMGALMDNAQMRSLFDRRVKKIAYKFLYSVQNQTKNNPTFFSLVAFGVQKRIFQKSYSENSIDSLYWKNHGWLEESATYYMQKAGTAKILLAQLVSAVVLKFIVS
jgi:Multimeric flavodoxin WrbA